MPSWGSEKRTRKLQLKEAYIRYRQGLIQEEKVHIDCQKGPQISILANKIATQWWPNIIKESK